MDCQPDQSDHAAKVKGLTTVALLKANYDAGMDYLEMYMPFVTEAIVCLSKREFNTAEIRDQLDHLFGLIIPLEIIKTLLKRAVKKKYVRREGGKYFQIQDNLKAPSIDSQKKQVERELLTLGNALQEFAATKGYNITQEDALSWLFAFLHEHQIELLLDDEYNEKNLRTGMLDLKQTRVVARFIQDRCLKDPQLAKHLENVLTGFVLQNTLLLKDVGSPSKTFSNLTVYFDSGFLLALLGWKGEAIKLANREILDLLKATNARCAVFDKTVWEMKRILSFYESHLATSRGRDKLWQNAITRHVLSSGLGPSDIKQAIGLLEFRLGREYGINIVQTPRRIPKYTFDEVDLTERFKGIGDSGDEPRILHDVDCIAAVLTIRRGIQPVTLNNAKAVFATGNGQVFQTVNKWFIDSGEKGISPIVHQLTLSNIAWLKRPETGSKLKLHELVALCAAALRPFRKTWERFLKHLRHLENTGELSSDESVSIVASSFTDRVLVEMEDREEDMDAASLTEVVDRVKDGYRQEAEKKIIDITRQKEQSDSKQLSTVNRIKSRSQKIACMISSAVFWVATAIVLVGVILMLPLGLKITNLALLIFFWIAVIFVTCLTVLGRLYGTNLKQLQDYLQLIIQQWLIKWLIGS